MCRATARLTLIAQDGVTNTGSLQPNEDFACQITTDLCVITARGPQQAGDGNVVLDEVSDVLRVDVDLWATNDGSEICGPAMGALNISADYAISPANLSFDP